MFDGQSEIRPVRETTATARNSDRVDDQQRWFDNLCNRGDDLLGYFLERCAQITTLVEAYASPIEKAMAMSMVGVCIAKYDRFRFVSETGLGIDDAKRMIKDEVKWAPGLIIPQVIVGQYRVDFLIIYGKGKFGWGGVVVECDGHEFHEKTKEQASHDKARDRYLQSLGLKVFHFSGSDIWNDPFGCAEQALDQADSLALDADYASYLLDNGDVDGALKYVARYM